MKEFLDTYVKLVTEPTFRDILSYKTRTTKRLLRRALRLANEVSRGDQVQKDATYVEVWFASLVPVMQGYWQSRIAEGKKKEVLDGFHRAMLNIIFNDVVTPSDAFQKLKPDAHDVFHDKVIDDLT